MLAYCYSGNNDTHGDILICNPADGNLKTMAADMKLSSGGTGAGIPQIRAVNTIDTHSTFFSNQVGYSL